MLGWRNASALGRPRPDCRFFAGNGAVPGAQHRCGRANAGRVGHPECRDATPQRRVVAIAELSCDALAPGAARAVGIGTTSPATTFSVVGSGYLTGGLGVGT
jgi:hypothetical protein